MSKFQLTVTGSAKDGTQQTQDPNAQQGSVEQLVQKFVQDLQAAGHTVDSASYTTDTTRQLINQQPTQQQQAQHRQTVMAAQPNQPTPQQPQQDPNKTNTQDPNKTTQQPAQQPTTQPTQPKKS